MEIEARIKKMKDILITLIEFIDASDNPEAEFQALNDKLKEHKILHNDEEVQLLFQLILKIASNHRRLPDFFDKLDQIMQILIQTKPSPISKFIPDFQNYNKLIIFFLLEKGFVIPDQSFLDQYLQRKQTIETFSNNPLKNFQSDYFYYLYPIMKEFIEEKMQEQIEKEIFQLFDVDIQKFAEKCQIGENDSYICSLIRKDSIEEFVVYVSRTNLSLCTKIEPSIYETNLFLIDRDPTLIEYAAFFGSIQIIQYLKYNEVQLTGSLWLYAVHSNNPELIHFLEENEVNLSDSLPIHVLLESIKCHHNANTNYIKDNFDDKMQIRDRSSFNDIIFNSLNFLFYPDDIVSDACKMKDIKAFKSCQLYLGLTQITIPSSVTSIGDYAFEGCSSLKGITIPSSVTSIGNYAFEGCSSLKGITIPSSVTSIGYYVFFRCSSLTNISIPSSSILFGIHAFDGVRFLNVTGNIKNIECGLFSECESLVRIKLPSSITSIGNYAFNGCSSLREIIIPSSVTSIGNSAFEGCSSLKQITIPSFVTSIGNSVFRECSSLTQITIPSSVTSIGDSVFFKCLRLTQITIPSSVTSIGESVFRGCSSLTQITIPSSVSSIGDSVFKGCSSLTQITIPSSVSSIGDYAFSECSSLTQIAFSIPSSVSSIGDYAFSRCSSLARIEIPSSVTSIGDYAFSRCLSLKQITIPSSVTSIGDNVFYGCLLRPAE